MLQFWDGKPSALYDLWLILNLDIPLFPFAHLEELVDHLGNAFHLLVWSLFDRLKKLPHGFPTISNRIWNTVTEAELCWNIYGLITLSYDDHWLVLITNLELVGFVEVFSD